MNHPLDNLLPKHIKVMAKIYNPNIEKELAFLKEKKIEYDFETDSIFDRATGCTSTALYFLFRHEHEMNLFMLFFNHKYVLISL